MKYFTDVFVKECKELGIDSYMMNRYDGVLVHFSLYFKNEEDLNLYRLTGSIKEAETIKFRLEK